jgi:hypothetical protein
MFSTPIALAAACRTLWAFCAGADTAISAARLNDSHSRVAMIPPPAVPTLRGAGILDEELKLVGSIF